MAASDAVAAPPVRLDDARRSALACALPARLRARLRFDERLAPHTTWKIGGPADVWVEVRSVRELVAFLRVAGVQRVPVRILGAGSNVLVSDDGAAGAILVLGGDFERVVEERAGARTRYLAVGAAVRLTAFARRISNEGWAGLEFAVGIPSTVGGALVMNAGAHGSEMRNVVRWVEIVSAAGERSRVPAADLAFGYRHTRLPRGSVVTRVGLALHRAAPAAIRERVRAHLDYRKRTQPLTEPSCGSVFVNPAGGSAGRVVEEAGLKGRRVGGASISTKHANFIVNQGDATAADVVALIHEARARVRARTGIELVPEVKPFGDFAGGAPW